MPHTQEGRLISITTPLGDDVLLLSGFSGHEAISRLFSFHLDLLSEQPSIDFTQIIGQSVTISIAQHDDTQRYINGMVSHFAQSGADTAFTHFQMQVVPWTWMLTRYADCKIFHNKAVGDIIEQVFSDRGFTDYKLSLSGSYSPIEYCVQYRETDFNFISRLMEQNGIFYFFQHEMGKHTMVIADASSIHEACPGQESAGYNLATGGLDAGDVIDSWQIEQELRTGKYTLTDYNFTTPSTSLLATEPTIVTVGGNSNFEIFDFPGEYGTRGDGTNFAKLRMQEEEAVHLIAHGSGVCRAFTTGYKFDLTDHYQDNMNTTYVLTEIQHIASVGGTYTGSDSGNDSYSNHFTCIPATVPFRPARLTPKPFVQGPQTAVVVGKSQIQGDGAGIEDDGGSTEDIWVDKYGRVVVLFPWDRKGACSCRVRVSQEWAGEGWGSITIPRVGQEVIVSFLEGDPDRPIITGRVYNATQTVPYTLPDYQTRSTFMTRSSTGGSASTYNELRFEDKTGKEQVFLRAQFDQDNYVTNDSREWIGNNRSLVVTKDQMESVGGDRHEQVTGKHIEKIGGDSNSNVTGNVNQKVGQTLSLQVGQNLYEKSGQNYGHQAGQAIHLKAGMTVVLEAGTEICLKVGGNFIDINPSGVSIVGTMVMINSGGSAGSGCGSSPTDPASPTDPDLADDGKSGTKRGSGSSSSSSSSGSSGGGGSAPASTPSSPPPAAAASLSASSPPSSPAAPANPSAPPASAANAMSGAASQAGQTAQQAAQGAQQAADQAQQAANQAQQAAQQAEQQAQQAVNQATQDARQSYQQANQAVQQAQQAVNQATAQGKAAAQQALNQAQQQAQQTAQAAAQAVQQAQQQAQQVQQQAQQAAQQAQQQAQQAAAQAQQAAQQAQQQGQQAAAQAQQAEQQAQQAAAQAQQAAKQAEQQAQQAGQQVKQAASQAQQQAQQAAQGAQQSASQAINQAQRGF